MHHFIVGGDKAGSQALEAKEMVHGDNTKKKHETPSHDPCKSISIYWMETQGRGSTGPIYAYSTERPKELSHYTPEFLINHDTVPGIVTNVAWNSMSESHCQGLVGAMCTILKQIPAGGFSKSYMEMTPMSAIFILWMSGNSTGLLQ